MASPARKSSYIRLFFSFMLAVLTALLAMTGIFSATLFSEDYLLRHMEKSGYYANTVLVLQEEYAALPSGIDKDFFDTMIDEDGLYRHIHGAVQAAYAGKPYAALNKAALTEDFHQKLLSYAAQKGLTLSDEDKAGLKGFADTCATLYVKWANHILPRLLGQYTHRYQNWLFIGIGILALLVLLCLWMIWKLSEHPHQAVRCWNSSFLGSAVMLTAVPAWMYLSRGVERLGITSRSLHPLVVSYTNALLLAFLICGAVIAAAVFTAGIISVHMLKKHVI